MAAAGPGDGATGPGPGGNGRLRIHPLLGAMADAFHGHHLHVSDWQSEESVAGIWTSGDWVVVMCAGGDEKDWASEGTRLR